MRGRKLFSSSFPYVNGKGFAYITHILMKEGRGRASRSKNEKTERGSLLLSPSLEVAREILEIRYRATHVLIP